MEALKEAGAIEHWECTTGFIDANTNTSESAYCPRLYRGPRGMDSLCTHLLTDSETYFGCPVTKVDFDGKEWAVYDGTGNELARADHLIISSMAIACSLRWQRLFGKTAPLTECSQRLGHPELSAQVELLEANGDTSKPVFTLLMAFERGKADWIENIPFDLNVIKGHPNIAKVVRNRCATAEYDSITVHSTHEFARQATDVFGSKSSVASFQASSSDKQAREEKLKENLLGEWADLMKEWCGENGTTDPDWGPYLHRWGGAFSTSVLDSPVTIDDMKLSICGDFVGAGAGSVESAAKSGVHVARIALATHGYDIQDFEP